MSKLKEQIEKCNELLKHQVITIKQDGYIANECDEQRLYNFTVDEWDLRFIGDDEIAEFSDAKLYGIEYIKLTINCKDRYFYFTNDSFFNHKITQISDSFVKFYGYDDTIKVDFETEEAKR